MTGFTEIDRALLDRAQRQRLEIYEQGFQSTFWDFVRERFQERFDALAHAYDAAVGAQQLGRAQGMRYVSQEIANLEDVIAREFQALVEEVAPEPEGPEFDDKWHD